jgi:HEAT repeat protein
MPRTYAKPCTLTQLAKLLTTDEGVPGIEEWIESFRSQITLRRDERTPLSGFGYFWFEHGRLKFKAKQDFYAEIETGKPVVRRRDDVIGAIARAFHAGHDAVVMPGIGTFFSVPREPGPGVFVKLADDRSFENEERAQLEQAILEAKDEDLAYAAAKLAKQDPGDLIAQLVEQVTGRGAERRARAALAISYLFHHGAPRPRGAEADALVDALVAAARDKNARLRSNALFAIAELGPLAKRAADVVLDALVDEDADIRERAAYALLAMPDAAAGALPTIIDQLRRETGYMTPQHLIGVLGKLDDPRVVAPLVELLGSDDDEIRSAALKALRARKPTDRATRTALEKLVAESEAEIRKVVTLSGGRDKLDELGHEIVRARQAQLKSARSLLARAASR